MNNKVRFFTATDVPVYIEFENATIPQIGGAVFLDDGLYRITDITYDYGYPEDSEQYVLIDVFVEKEPIDEL